MLPNMAQVGPQRDEFLDETNHMTGASQYSIKQGKVCDNLLKAPSERSNLAHANSSHDSISENVENKTTVRTPEDVDASEVVGTLKSFIKYEGSKGVEQNDENLSCLSRASHSDTAVNDYSKDLDSKNYSCSSASVSSLGRQVTRKELPSQQMNFSELPFARLDARNSSKLQGVHCQSQGDKHDVGGSSETSKVHAKLETDADNLASENLPDKAPNFLNEDDQVQINKSVDVQQEAPIGETSGNESDESDAVEHDVKVCDICGDAGREDLLATCSKCIDGAEHTYCMRERLLEVPEGDWLCEECKLAEEAENLNQDSDADGKRVNKISLSRENSVKRLAEDLEGAPAAKRQAIDANVGSPKSSSPGRAASLSRESSFKSIDKGKMQSSSHISYGNHSNSDVSENTCSPVVRKPAALKGTFSKSSSFSSKPKVKLVEKVFPQQPKRARDDTKEDSVRIMGKSMSFKPTSSGRLNAGESKVKMLSPRHSHVHDPKGLKQLKERVPFERKIFGRPDSFGSTVSAPKVDQKLTSRAEMTSKSSVSTNNRDPKVANIDGKPCTLLRSTSSLGRKGVENSVSSAVGASSTNGIQTSERKINQASLRDEPSSSASRIAERSSNYLNGVLQDGLSRISDSTNQGEKLNDSSANFSLKKVPCKKCKEIGHTTESCSVDIAELAGMDIPTSGYSREVTNKGNKLKAAIEAAIRIKPGIRERASQDQFSVSNKEKFFCAVESTQGRGNQTNSSNMKQLTAHLTDAVSAVPSGGCPTTRDWSTNALAMISCILSTTAIPEHKYIWQGEFELHRDGRLPDICGGVQAHLSRLASPKVLQMVNTFANQVTLNEVPRLSTWPTQFHRSGPKEDNIALYFFAKDLESYEKKYKGLLENMIKKDLALKGKFDGVELLIFSSNQLPENCQRWNTLFFLWGVFRGRRVGYSSTPSSSMVPLDNGIPREDHQKIHSPKPLDNESAIKRSDSKAVHSTNSSEKTCSIIDVCDKKVSPLEQISSVTRSNSVKLDNVVDSKPLTRMGGSGIQMPELEGNNQSQQDHSLTGCVLLPKVKSSLQATGARCGSISSEKVQTNDIKGTSTLEGVPAEYPEAGVSCSVKEIDGYPVKVGNSVDDYRCANRPVSGDHKSLQLSHHRPCLDLSEVPMEVSNDTSQKSPWTEVNRTCTESHGEKSKAGFSGIYDTSSSRNQSSSSGGFASRINDLGTCSTFGEKRCDAACEEKVILEDLGTSERFFFHEEFHGGEEFRLGKNTIFGKSSRDGDRVHERVPNLELALGADVKQLNKGILPFFAGMMDNNNIGKPMDKILATDKHTVEVIDKPEEDVSATLSLSLSFPFPDKEQVKPIQKTEQQKHPVNTSLLLFGDLEKK